MAKATKKRNKRKVLSAEEKKLKQDQTKHKKTVRSCLENVGFLEIKGLSDREFQFDGTVSDFDDVYFSKNVVVLVEYTLTSALSDHIKKKKILYDKIESKPAEFHDFLKSISSEYSSVLPGDYLPNQLRFRILYCCGSEMSASLKNEVPSACVLDGPLLHYFKLVTGSIYESAVHEFLEFLGVPPTEYGEAIIKPNTAVSEFFGSLLPHSHSNFDKGFRVVSFYIDPESLLERCFVLRRSTWDRAPNLYQRMVHKKKIGQIRQYLLSKKRVFLNNIIVSLPPDVRILKGGEEIKGDVDETQEIRIQLPERPNSVCLIDGQHRVYSYHSGGTNEDEIRKLRKHLNLLVTGIVFPDEYSETLRTQFEARLFLEINSTQTGAKSDLKQEIGVILKPFSIESISRRVLMQLGREGPLAGMLSSSIMFGSGIRTTTIVSYGLVPLLKLSGTDSVFSLLPPAQQAKLSSNPDAELVDQYVASAVKEVNTVLAAAKKVISKERWLVSADKKSFKVTPTLINGLIAYLRLAIGQKRALTFEAHSKALKEIMALDPMQYKSSQYNRLGRDIFAKAYPSIAKKIFATTSSSSAP